jgi:hypothetical protein
MLTANLAGSSFYPFIIILGVVLRRGESSLVEKQVILSYGIIFVNAGDITRVRFALFHEPPALQASLYWSKQRDEILVIFMLVTCLTIHSRVV